MADPDSSSVQKPFVYELISRLNVSFGRVFSNLSALKKTGAFTPATIERLENLSDELRADANFHLLEIMRDIEERDWARCGQLRTDDTSQIQ
jgi:hypothetical protein